MTNDTNNNTSKQPYTTTCPACGGTISAWRIDYGWEAECSNLKRCPIGAAPEEARGGIYGVSEKAAVEAFHWSAELWCEDHGR